MAIHAGSGILPVTDGEGRRFPQYGPENVDLDEFISRNWSRHSAETPFWRDRAYDLGLDSSDITSFDDIYAALEASEESALNSHPFDYFIRDDLSMADYDVGRSSGKTGPKKAIPWHTDVSDRTVDWYEFNIANHGVEDIEAAVILGPYGIYERHTTGAVKQMGGTPLFQGMETQGFKNEIVAAMQGDVEAEEKLDARMAPTMEAVYNDLRTEPVDAIITAPVFAKDSVGVLPDDIHGMLTDERTVSEPEDIELLLLSGTQIDGGTVEGIENAYENAVVLPMYASSWFGPAFPPSGYPEREDRAPEYYLPPEVPSRVVDSETGEEVGYGERGVLEITIANEGFFWPRQPEDYVTRIPPQEPFDWDGVRDVGRED